MLSLESWPDVDRRYEAFDDGWPVYDEPVYEVHGPAGLVRPRAERNPAHPGQPHLKLLVVLQAGPGPCRP